MRESENTFVSDNSSIEFLIQKLDEQERSLNDDINAFRHHRLNTRLVTLAKIEEHDRLSELLHEKLRVPHNLTFSVQTRERVQEEMGRG